MSLRKWISTSLDSIEVESRAVPVASFRKLFMLFWGLLLLTGPFSADAQQSRKELEDKRRKLLREIEQTSGRLKKTTENKAATLVRYVTLQKQIGKRQQLVETLQEEVALLGANIERTSGVVMALTEDIDRLEAEYAKMARHAYRQHLARSEWLFLLSSHNLNEAFRRWQYLREYDHYRQKQARLILETRQTLMDKIAAIEERKNEKERLLNSERRQTEILNLEMSAKNRLLTELKGDEARLARQLEEKRKAEASLSSAIERVIREEMERARRESAAAARPGTKSKSTAPSESSVLSGDFRSNRGKLPWPVKEGSITGQFGRQPHPSIPSVEIVNNGIDIQTETGSAVRSVFEGDVAGVQFVPGYDYMVIVRHGVYYTVYSRLSEVTVAKGDRVTSRQTIGKVSTDRKSNVSEVHFEIWQEKTRLNPQDWVARGK